MKKIFLLLLSVLPACTFAAPVKWYDGKSAVSYGYMTVTENVVKVAAGLFEQDMKEVTGLFAQDVTGQKAVECSTATIQIYQLDKATKKQKAELKKLGFDIDFLQTSIDAFQIKVAGGHEVCPYNGQRIIIVGGNGRGAAYGLLELSRMAGVSPWVWWGDVAPEKKSELTINSTTDIKQSASVELRGIFLNDEDWSLRPWSYLHFEPADFGQIGPKTYRKVFELLLRLRANAIWPAMHTGTEAFFKNPQNKVMADSCGIFVGTSHCEPLLRNNVDEWNAKERGSFNYITNKENVQKYWIERLEEVKNSKTNIFTIGMRGIHDGSMEGVKTTQEKFDALQQVINDQQELIRKYVGDPAKQPQVFVPYKEVLELYEKGLKVPDYVTLMWCDDNYGYMTRLSTPEEQKRSGGGGVYYHLSYWGRPHDFLWLTTTQPGLIYNEMKAAYDHNVRKLWIVNVHDPKVAGYDLELFLDMAWNINSVSGETLEDHYKAWLCRQFGEKAGEKLFPAMREFWRLTGERKPEFMGWNQNELDKKTYERGLSPVRNTEFSFTEFNSEADRYMASYGAIANVVENVGKKDIRPELRDAYFAAIKYPVLGSYFMAVKMLEAQRARSFATGSTLKDMYANNEAMKLASARSQRAYQNIRELTHYYNNTMADGKWKHSMDMNPRNQHVFQVPQLPVLLTDREVKEFLQQNPQSDKIQTSEHPDTRKSETAKDIISRNADTYSSVNGKRIKTEYIQLLGHSLNAVAIPKGNSLVYEFTAEKEGEALLHTALIPTQPNDNGDLRYSVSIDGGEPIVYSLKEKFRSEQWKINMLRGQARRTSTIHLTKGAHTLAVKALDDHIILDQWMIDFNLKRGTYYLFPSAVGADLVSVRGVQNVECSEPATVIITAGQSNTDGRVAAELPDYIKENGYKHCKWSFGSSGKIQTEGFEPFSPKTAHEKHPNSWAYDAVFYYLLEQDLQHDFYVIKWSLGGTAIDPSNKQSTHGKYWSANPEWLAKNKSTLKGGKSLLLSFTEEIDKCIDNQLSQLPNGYEIKAFLWHQGESDYTAGPLYYENLKGVVEYVRNYLVEKTGNKNYAKLPFICGTVARSNRCFNADVENAMWQLSKDMENFHVVDMSKGELQSDKLHFTAKSAEYLGKEMYNIYKTKIAQ